MGKITGKPETAISISFLLFCSSLSKLKVQSKTAGFLSAGAKGLLSQETFPAGSRSAITASTTTTTGHGPWSPPTDHNQTQQAEILHVTALAPRLTSA